MVFEPTIPAFEGEKTLVVHALDHVGTVIGLIDYTPTAKVTDTRSHQQKKNYFESSTFTISCQFTDMSHS
jgi:hypothetical protein